MRDPSTYDYECNKACNLMNIQILKIVLCKKRLIGKLVLECENKILNKTET